MKSCEELYTAVRPFIESGDYSQAIEGLKELLDTYPDFAQGHYELGALYFATGERQSALEKYKRAIEIEPKNTTFLKSLADYYYSENNDINEAKKLYHRVIKERPEHVECLQILGNLYVVERDFQSAKEFYNQVLDIEPWNHDALMIYEKLDQQTKQPIGKQAGEIAYAQSQRLVQAGKINEAIEVLETLIKENPDYAAAYNDLGVLYYQTDDKEKTLHYYEEAVRLEPNQLNFRKNLADFYFIELGRVQDALEIYSQLLNEDPTDIETLMATGYICKSLGRNEDAIVFFERVLDIEPWNFEASENINQLNPMQFDNI